MSNDLFRAKGKDSNSSGYVDAGDLLKKGALIQGKASEGLHPLIDSVIPKLLDHEVLYKKTLSSKDAVVRHYQLKSQSFLPEVAYLEMAYAAAKLLDSDTEMELRNVVWPTPTVVEKNQERVVIISLRSTEGYYEYEVKGEDGEQLYSKGEIHPVSVTAQSKHAPIEKIKSRSNTVISKAELYDRFHRLGLDYGEYLKSVTRIWSNGREVLAKLELPQEYIDELDMYTVHPSIMEGSIQAAIGFIKEEDTDGQSLRHPCCVDCMTVLSPLKTSSYVYIKPLDEGRFNLAILDNTGRVCVRIEGLNLRKCKDETESFLFKPEWVEEVSPQSDNDALVSKKVVIVYTEESTRLKDLIKEQHERATVFEILMRYENRELSHSQREVSSFDRDGFRSCKKFLRDVDLVYFLGCIQTQPPDIDNLKFLRQSLEEGVLGLYRLVNALKMAGVSYDALKLKIITNNTVSLYDSEMDNPFAGGILGLALTLAKEYPRWRVSCVDIDIDELNGAKSEEWANEWIMQAITETGHESGQYVFLRSLKRYVRRFTPIELPECETLPFKNNGVYLILGGAGGIGLELAAYLAQTVEARLILIDCNSLKPAQEEKIQDIRLLGGDVLYIRAEGTDYDSMSGAVAFAKRKFGHINGAFHSAVVLDDKTIANMEEDAFRTALSPKAEASVILYKVLKNEPMDFLVYFSSVQSFIGNKKQGNHAAGCTFEDSYAHAISKIAPFKVKTINWGYWGNVGVVSSEQHYQRFTSQGVLSIEPKEGFDTVSRMISAPIGQVVVFKAIKKVLDMLGVIWNTKPELQESETPSLIESPPETPSPIDLPSNEVEFSETPSLIESPPETPSPIDLPSNEVEFSEKPSLIESPFYEMEVPETPSLIELSPEKPSLIESPFYEMEVPETPSLIELSPEKPSLIDSPSNEVEFSEKPSLIESPSDELEVLPADALEVDTSDDSQVNMEQAFIPVVGIWVWGVDDKKFKAKLLSLAENYANGNEVELEMPLSVYLSTKKRYWLESTVSTQIYSSAKNVYHEENRTNNRGFIGVSLAKKTQLADDERLRGYRTLEKSILLGIRYLELICREYCKENGTASISFFNVYRASPLIEDEDKRVIELVPSGEESPLSNMVSGHSDGEEENHFEASVLKELVIEQLSCVEVDHIVEGGREDLGQDDEIIHESDDLVLSEKKANAEVLIDEIGNQALKKHMLEGESMVISDNLQEKLMDYIKGAFAKVLRVDKSTLENGVTFDKYGVNLLIATEISEEFERDFGNLPSSMLFESNTIERLAGYFISEHNSQTVMMFGPDSTQGEESDMVDVAKSEITVPVVPSGEFEEGDIAVIGLGGHYPESEDLDEFWLNLSEGRSCITEVPSGRWNWEGHSDLEYHNKGKGYSRRGGFIKDVDKFDPQFFNISPTEAESMDPQERLLLETAWETLEDAGYNKKKIKASNNRIGVFVGVMNPDYELVACEQWGKNNPTGAHSANWAVANRISFALDFNGPSFTVDTACSSSLTAIHIACESIKRKECELALAGGVNLILHPMHFIRLSGSKDDSHKSCGEGAEGLDGGEGVGAILLKPLSRAVSDGDRIYGVIKGSFINSSGKTSEFSVPSLNAQADLIYSALKRSNIDPATISYIEAHGTGSELGDSIEISGLQKGFSRATDSELPTQYCAIGSVKYNVGHLESATGIAGVSKILLMFKHRMIVPTSNCERFNKKIRFEETPFYVQEKLSSWEPKIVDGIEQPRRAGISSFGAGGANTHLILEEFTLDKSSQESYTAPKTEIIVLSAKTQQQLKDYAGKMLMFLERMKANGSDLPSLHSIAYTLQTGREAMDYRLALVASTIDELADTFDSYIKGQENSSMIFSGSIKETKKQLDFLYDEDSLELICRWMDKGKFEKVAQLWIKGFDLDWKMAYEHEMKPPIVSLPTYPFSKKRYWIKTDDNTVHPQEVCQKQLHPLLQCKYIIPLVNDTIFESNINLNTEPYFKDHKVDGKHMLSWSAIIAMLFEAEKQKEGIGSCMIRDLVFASPLELRAGISEKVQLCLSPKDNGYLAKCISVLEQESDKESENYILHTSAMIEGLQNAESSSSDIKLDDIMDVCKKEVIVDDYYKQLEAQQVTLGSSYRCINKLCIGEKQAVALYKIPKVHGDGGAYELHPGLIDSLFQMIAAIVDKSVITPQTYEPYRIESYKYYGLPRGEDLWGYVVLKELDVVKGRVELNLMLCCDDTKIVEVCGMEVKCAKAPDEEPQSPIAEEVNEIETITKSIVSQILGLEGSRMQANQPFLSMGLDSIMAMEISNQINKKTGIEVPIYKLLDDMTIDELISYVKSGSENVQNNTFKAADLIQEDVGDWEDELVPKGVSDYLGDISNLSEDRIDRILSLLSNN